MDVLSISQDNNDSDTSQEDFEDGDYNENLKFLVPNGETEQQYPTISFQEWRRPGITQTFTGNIEFMLMDSDFGILPTSKVNSYMIPLLHPQLQEIDSEQSYIRLHGLTRRGNTVCCNVFNFLPYFYAIPLPGSFSESDIPKLHSLLTSGLRGEIMTEMKSVPFHFVLQFSDPIISIELIDETNGNDIKIFDFVSLCQPSTSSKILKITCRVPKFVWTASEVLRRGIPYPVNAETGLPYTYEIYEGSVNHTIRFLTDLNIPGCSWIEIGVGKYYLRSEENKVSHAQLEFDVLYNGIDTNPYEDFIPPMRILSYDIEVMTRPPLFTFPINGLEQILQIGNVVSIHSESPPVSEQFKVVFTLQSCHEIPGTKVYSFESEKEMLNQWRSFLLAVDPDIVTGYNIKKFDFPYLLERANRIDMKSMLPFIGRVQRVQSYIRPIHNRSKGFTENDKNTLNLNGRVIFDMMLLIMRHNTIPSYTITKNGGFTLAEVARRYLNDVKEDVKYWEIFDLQNTGPETRKQLATYCVQDALLPHELMMKLEPDRKKPNIKILEYYIHKSRETGVLLKYLVTKSKNYESYYKRVRKAKNPGVVFHTPVKDPERNSKTSQRQNDSSRALLPPKKFKFW